ncbi:MAG: hypothetical protein GY762_23935 [Proteobacteria bacterium]|nr:hypothetical protein [Pseudomonadota bacterium]
MQKADPKIIKAFRDEMPCFLEDVEVMGVSVFGMSQLDQPSILLVTDPPPVTVVHCT